MKNLTNLLIKGAMAYALAMHGANAAAQQVALAAEQTPVTAIDILLEPDTTMLRHCEANNARLLKVYPKGFSLDAAHRPHITMIQCFVRTADLDKVYAAEEKVLASANVNAMKWEAFKYYYAPAGATGVAGICAKPTPAILKLQADIIAAAKPFILESGPIGAAVYQLGPFGTAAKKLKEWDLKPSPRFARLLRPPTVRVQRKD